MPSIVTHHLFAKDIMPKKNINKNIYYIFAQSFDILFYYSFFFPLKGKQIRTLGIKAQQEKTDIFFLNALNYIKNNNLKNNPDIMAFLYGSITHYALDKTAHPFIIYQENNIRGNHEKIETMIDAIIYQEKTNKPIYKANLANTLLPKINFPINLKKLLDTTYDQTFNIKDMGKKFNQSLKTGNFIIKYFVTDHTGIKKQIYKIKDKIGNKYMYQYLDFHITNLDYQYLNLDHHKWHYKANPKIVKNDSFYDLYNTALITAKDLFNLAEKYLNNQISAEKILKEFNQSYTTGLDYKLKNTCAREDEKDSI